MKQKIQSFLTWFFSSWQVLAVAVGIAASVNVLVYYLGRAHERATRATIEAAQAIQDIHDAFDQEVARMNVLIERAQTATKAAERARAANQSFYNRLNKEANHDPVDVVDSCVLPDERLRRWRDANDGPAAARGRAGASKSDDGASAPAATRERSDARSGGESP